MAAEPLMPPVPVGDPTSAGRQSSHVRSKDQADGSRAARRIGEYLAMLGSTDRAHIRSIAESVASDCWCDDSEQHARRAMELLLARVEAWQKATFADLPHLPSPAWLRAFLATHPRALLDDPSRARALADTFGDPLAGTPPLAATFVRQSLGRPRLPAWLRGLLLPTLTTGLATGLLAARVLAGPPRPLEALWLALFACLFGQAALGFFTALRGFAREATPELPGRAQPPAEPDLALQSLPRTAVAVPIYHESATDVFAGVAAMRESLLGLPDAPAIEIFVLSDSRDPLTAAEEERAHRRVMAQAGLEVPVYYRRRATNLGQKAGNLAEFFERWGDRYEYVIVLDADSLMQGETMLELIRRMHRAPRVALLQAPIVPIRGQTLLARALAWATSVAGPLFTRGLMRWAGPHANYYGHNAILRTRAFLECCALPTLAGKPPLGGPLLSHDFVEAALLCRSGWEVRLASDLGGSYEELPPTLAQYVARDRRWSQGNLQHLRVLLAPGLPMMSRLHLLLGATAYLAGPAWVAFLSIGLALGEGHQPGEGGGPLVLGGHGLALVLGLLVGPRVLGVIATLRERRDRAEHGGAGRLVASFFVELGLSALLGPILMLHHTRMVVAIVLGRAVSWGAAGRKAVRGLKGPKGELGNMVLGLLVAVFILRVSVDQALWLSPVWLPLAFAAAIAALLDSERVGRAFAHLGLLLVPSETHPDPLAERARELRTLTEGDSAGRFRDLVLDPVLVAAHLERLKASARPAPEGLRERALRIGPAGLNDRERQLLLEDPGSLRWLHREAWQAWPTETWQLARHVRQLPAESV